MKKNCIITRTIKNPDRELHPSFASKPELNVMIARDGRAFYKFEAVEQGGGPFAQRAVRVIFGSLEGFFKIGHPDAIQAAIESKAVVEGLQIHTGSVPAYRIGDRTATTYTALLLPHESSGDITAVLTRMTNSGRVVVPALPAPSVAEPTL